MAGTASTVPASLFAIVENSAARHRARGHRHDPHPLTAGTFEGKEDRCARRARTRALRGILDGSTRLDQSLLRRDQISVLLSSPSPYACEV
jgi:hypothetical protein